MRDIKYQELKAADPLLEQTETLFKRLYEYMAGKGLFLPLVPGGEKMWLHSLLPTLSKFGVVWLALDGDEVIGFAQGTVKLLPNYLGGGRVGMISHVYVDPEVRSYGIGSKLVERVENWFIMKKVDSIELQVLYRNECGRSFWEKLGYDYEVYQMRKSLAGFYE